MPSEFKENAEDLNTDDSVQADVNGSMTNSELDVEAIRENIRLYELDDGGDTPAQGEYTDSDLAVRDIRRLLDKVDSLLVHNGVLVTEIRFQAERADKAARERDERPSSRDLLVAEEKLRSADIEQRKLLARIAVLEELKCAVCGRRVAHLNCNGHVIGWGCADGEECKAAPEMPRPPAEEERDENAFDRGFGNCPHCRSPRVAHCHECLNDIERDAAHAAGWRMDHLSGFGCIALCPDCRGDDETPVPAAQERSGDTDTAGTGSGRGTGVAEPSGTAQVRDAYRPEYASTLLRLIDEAQTTTPFYRRPVIVQDDIITDAGFLRDAVVAVWNAVSQLLPSLPVPSTERPADER